jgi:uncharacterized C2H2 Zn-finger protein
MYWRVPVERTCIKGGIKIAIPKGEDLRKCPRCKGLLVDAVIQNKKGVILFQRILQDMKQNRNF